MQRTLAATLLAGGLALTGLPARAAEPSPGQQLVVEAQKEQLAARSKELERKLHRPVAANFRNPAAGAERARKSRIRRQQREIESLIQRLEAGEDVAPGEVERLRQAQ
jgi:hypothetical protein